MRPVVAALRTSPETVIEDHVRLLDLAGCAAALGPDGVFVKPVHSHDDYFPSVSSPPWQLDGVLTWLSRRGVPADRVAVGEAPTVCTSLDRVLASHGWGRVLARHGVAFHPLDRAPRQPLHADPARLAWDWAPVGGPSLPEVAAGRTLLHLVPLKVHGHSVMTGSAKAAFNLLQPWRTCHLAHPAIHDVLADMLWLERELGAPTIGLVDATWCGDGRGPVTVRPVRQDLILASRDLVALDSVCASFLGFDPREVPFLRLAHARGLGEIDPARIEVVGEDPRRAPLRFRTRLNAVLFADQLVRRRLGGGGLPAGSRRERLAILASRAYHNGWWRYARAPWRARAFRASGWAAHLRPRP